MKRTFAILTLVIAVALSGIFAIAMAQSSSVQHDHSGHQNQSDKGSHSMMSHDGMHGMMHGKDSMACPMMSGDPKAAGQHMLMMLKDEKHRQVAVEVLKQSPELREQIRQLLQKAEE